MEAHVYFLADEPAGLIKIGLAGDVRQRVGQLRRGGGGTHRRRRLVGAIAGGGRRLEWALHREFAELRREGEWFEAAPRLVEWIEQYVLPLGQDGAVQPCPSETEMDRLLRRRRCDTSFATAIVVLVRYIPSTEIAERLAVPPQQIVDWAANPHMLRGATPPAGWKEALRDLAQGPMCELMELWEQLSLPSPGEPYPLRR